MKRGMKSIHKIKNYHQKRTLFQLLPWIFHASRTSVIADKAEAAILQAVGSGVVRGADGVQ